MGPQNPIKSFEVALKTLKVSVIEREEQRQELLAACKLMFGWLKNPKKCTPEWLKTHHAWIVSHIMPVIYRAEEP